MYDEVILIDAVRLIDANALIEDCKSDLANYKVEALRGDAPDSFLISAVIKRIEEVIERIKDAPTIEAQPIKYGSIERLTNAEKHEIYYESRIDFDGKCSECGSLVFDTDNFCSECGAVFHNEEDSDDK